jgi:predicted ester cyclase
MPVEDNKQAARRFYQEVINGRNLDAMDELLTSDGVDHTFGSQNAEQAKQFFGMVHQAFPDLHAELHDVIAEGELVAARVTYTGPHQGEFLGIPRPGSRPSPTGSTCSGCRTAGRPSTGAGRTRSASWYSWASCPDQARPPERSREGHGRPFPGQEATGPAVPAPRRRPAVLQRRPAPPGAAYSRSTAGMRSWIAVRRQLRAAARDNELTDERPRRSRPVRWAWLDLNQRPHPYQQSRAQRCADRRFPRSRATVRGQVMRSNNLSDRGGHAAVAAGKLVRPTPSPSLG